MFVYSFEYRDIPILLRRQYCPHCGKKLLRSYGTTVIPRDEVKPSCMYIGDVSFSGNLEDRQFYYYCEECETKYLIEQIREAKRHKKE